MGVVTLFSIFLFFTGFYEVNIHQFIEIMQSLKDYSNVALLLTMSLSYQLGWLVNKISYYGIPSFCYWHSKKRICGDDAISYYKIRDYVFLNASSNAIDKLKERLSSIRLLRAGVFNMLVLTIGVVTIENYRFLLVSTTLLLLFSVATYFAYGDYIHRVKNIYDNLTK